MRWCPLTGLQVGGWLAHRVLPAEGEQSSAVLGDPSVHVAALS